MLIFWCMAALAALLLYWKLQTVTERRKSKEEQAFDAADAKADAEMQNARQAAEEMIFKP